MEERPFSGKYWNSTEKRIYTCAVCGNELFSSKAKFDPGTGWASFLKPIDPDSIETKDGAKVACKQCGGHLGELAGEKDRHYRINSMALDFEEAEESALMGNLKDELQGRAEDKLESMEDEEESEASTQKSPGWSLKNVLVLLGAVALGAGVGAGISTFYGGLMCQINSSQAPAPVTVLPPTSTVAKPPIKPPAKPAGNGAPLLPGPTSSSSSTATAGSSSGTATTTPAAATTSPGSATGI